MNIKKKIMLVFGTRPEAIKLAPVIIKLRNHLEIKTIICVTGQHRGMLDQVLDNFNITPDIDLNLMKDNQSICELAGRTINTLSDVYKQYKPNLIMVQGDTTTVISAALAAFYCQIPVAHIEAGLRTGDLSAPWPEEGNRVLTSRLATLHFAPTEWAYRNLIKEGIAPDAVFTTGNTVIDALFMTLKEQNRKALNQSKISNIIELRSNKRIVLITGHRRENFGRGLENICFAIKKLSELFPDVNFVYPVHLNPKVRESVEKILIKDINKNIRLLDPLSYNDFIALMSKSYLILTDSGGIQEEASSLGIPVLIMREKTERPEAVEAGTAKLVGTDKDKIIKETSIFLNNRRAYKKMSTKSNIFGDGKSSKRIIEICLSYLINN